MTMTGEAKSSETKAAKSELSVSVILFNESKEEEKTLALSIALAELVVDRKEDKQFQVIVKGSKRKRLKLLQI